MKLELDRMETKYAQAKHNWKDTAAQLGELYLERLAK
jgi:hypothetical protein